MFLANNIIIWNRISLTRYIQSYCSEYFNWAKLIDDLKKEINSQIKKPHLERIPYKENYKFGTDPTMEDQIRRTNNWIYKTKKSHLDRPSGPVAQLTEALSLYGSR